MGRLAVRDYSEPADCERCGWPLLMSAYFNGQTKCGVCYGLEKGYYADEEVADRIGREPPEDWLDRNRWLLEGGGR